MTDKKSCFKELFGSIFSFPLLKEKLFLQLFLFSFKIFQEMNFYRR